MTKQTLLRAVLTMRPLRIKRACVVRKAMRLIMYSHEIRAAMRRVRRSSSKLGKTIAAYRLATGATHD